MRAIASANISFTSNLPSLVTMHFEDGGVLRLPVSSTAAVDGHVQSTAEFFDTVTGEPGEEPPAATFAIDTFANEQPA